MSLCVSHLAEELICESSTESDSVLIIIEAHAHLGTHMRKSLKILYASWLSTVKGLRILTEGGAQH